MDTKLAVLLLLALLAADAIEGKRQSVEDYEDVPEKPYPGKVQIMPIVQRDTKSKSNVKNTVQEIIRELPTDESFERIGKMLNESYDKINRDAKEGESAIRVKMGDKTDTNSGNGITIFFAVATIVISFFN